MFANSTAETSTDTEKAFGKAFAAQFGNIALIVFLVVGAAFVTILMIVGNTMALSIRERTREIGVLKTLGFSGGRILRMVLGESVLLALLGGVAGAGDRRADHAGAARQPGQFRAGLCGDAGHRVAGACADDRARPDHRDHSGAQCHAAQDRHRARTGLTHAFAFAAGRSRSPRSISRASRSGCWLSLSTVVAVALVVIVLLAFLAMANGFQRTIAGSGADDIAIVLRGRLAGRDQQHGVAAIRCA